jgi:iron complex outermembrane receptor protein
MKKSPSILALAVAAVAASSVAEGQNQTASPEAKLEEIVVTARLRAERLQDVPASIAAFDETWIERAQLNTLDKLSFQVPSLAASDPFGRNNLSIAMRGIGLAGIGDELPVGLFVDGVYVAGRSSGNLLITDVERIEVARGPQSALYGRNTFAGAVNFVTRKPSEDTRGFLEGSAGTKDRYEVRGDVSGPLIADRMYGQIGGVWRDWGGYFDNAALGGDLNRQRTSALSGKLRFTPTDDLEALLSVAYSEDDDSQPAAFLVPANTGLTVLNGGSLGFFTGTAPEKPAGGASCCVASNDAGGFQREGTRAALAIDYRLSDSLALKSISAWSTQDQVYDQDVDYYTDKLFVFGNRIERDDLSQELRVQYDGDGVRALAGAFYYEFDNTFTDRGAAQFFLPPAARQTTLARNQNSFRSRTKTEAYALFGSLGVEFAQNWEITADIRWGTEKKTFDYIRQIQTGRPDPRRSESWDSWTPRLTVDWKPQTDALYYISAARGFKTGGFNDQINIFESERAYDPESNWTYELGTKQALLEGRLQANLTLFYIDWTDQQVVTASAAGSANNTYVANAAESTSKGFELDLTANPVDGLRLNAALALADAKFDNFVDPALAGGDVSFPVANRPTVTLPGLKLARLPNGIFGADVSGNRIPRTSKWQWALSGEYSRPLPFLAGAEGFVRADYTYRSTQYAETSNLAGTGNQNKVNLRLGVETSRYSVSLWVDNLLDDRTSPVIIRFSDFGSFFAPPVGVLNRAFQVTPADGRTFGVTLRVKFGDDI